MIELIFQILLIGSLGQELSDTNFWMRWANRTGNSAFCLHLTAATDPFKTCLVGIPIPPAQIRINSEQFNCSQTQNNNHCLSRLIKSINKTLLWDPQEINLLDSRKSNHSGCLYFGSWNLTGSKGQVWMTPHKNYNVTQYCGSYPYGWTTGQETLSIDKPLALPTSIYLICGDRAWQGIPRFAHGGPCYLGHLTLLAPSKEFLKSFSNTIVKRSVSTLDPECVDEVELWSATARFFAALIPSIGTAQALTQLQHLACWSVKQANVTTQIISQMAQDMSSLRQAVIQNRAAIDFLLLAQGKGCEDFQGMCCFNLSDHSDSIHKQLQWLQEHTKKITVNHNPFDEWLLSFGISAWLKEGIKMIIIVVLIVIIVFVMGPCILHCFSSQINKLADSVFEKRGGDVAGLTGAVMLQPFYRKLP